MQKNLHTFAIRVNESSFDESPYQKIMSDYAGTIHHQIDINADDIRNNLHSYIAFTDEPYADGSAIPTMLLSQEAKKYVKVLLSGEGGMNVLVLMKHTKHTYIESVIDNIFQNFYSNGLGLELTICQ